MVKRHYCVSLDMEIVTKIKLKTDDFSGLINDLLSEWAKTGAKTYKMAEIKRIKLERDEARALLVAKNVELAKMLKQKKNIIRIIDDKKRHI